MTISARTETNLVRDVASVRHNKDTRFPLHWWALDFMKPGLYSTIHHPSVCRSSSCSHPQTLFWPSGKWYMEYFLHPFGSQHTDQKGLQHDRSSGKITQFLLLPFMESHWHKNEERYSIISLQSLVYIAFCPYEPCHTRHHHSGGQKLLLRKSMSTENITFHWWWVGYNSMTFLKKGKL